MSRVLLIAIAFLALTGFLRDAHQGRLTPVRSGEPVQTLLGSYANSINPGEIMRLPGTRYGTTTHLSGAFTVAGSAWYVAVLDEPNYVKQARTGNNVVTLTRVADDNSNPGADNWSWHSATSRIYVGSNPTLGNYYEGGSALLQEEHDAIVATYGGQQFWAGNNPGEQAIRAWNGPAWDAAGRRYWVHGGGHASYGGNEIQQFDLDTFTWTRIFDPSPRTGVDLWTNPPFEQQYADDINRAPAEGPFSRHVYGHFEYFPPNNELWLVGGGTGYTYGMDATETNVVNWTGAQPVDALLWVYDLDVGTWSSYDNSAQSPTQYGPVVYNPATGRMTIFPSGGSDVEYEITAAYSAVNAVDQTPSNYRSRAIAIGGFIYHLSSPSGTITKYTIGASSWAAETITNQIPASLASRFWGEWGMDWDSVNQQFVLWDGGAEIWSYTPATNIWRQYMLTGTVPSNFIESRVYGAWRYVPAEAVFIGMSDPDEGFWAYKHAPTVGSVIDPTAVVAKIGAVEYQSLQEAFDAVAPSQTVTIQPGTWQVCGVLAQDNVTVNGPGAVLDGVICQGKAAIVATGDNTIIEDIEFTNIHSLSDCNAAAVRLEGLDLTLDGIYVHDSDEGMLGGGGDIVVQNSQFHDVGAGGCDAGSIGRAHGIYISSSSDSLTAVNNVFTGGQWQGHHIKTRALVNTIYNNVLANVGGAIAGHVNEISHNINIPNGGIANIYNNVILHGPGAAVRKVFTGTEEACCPAHTVHEIVIHDNLIIADDDVLVWDADLYDDLIFTNNVVVGTSVGDFDYTLSQVNVPIGNTTYADRTAAGLSAYPAYPSAPYSGLPAALTTAADTSSTSVNTPVSNVDVLTNDSGCTVVTQSTARNGTIVVEGDNELTYTPDTDYTGTDTIIYGCTNGSGVAGGYNFVTMTVNP